MHPQTPLEQLAVPPEAPSYPYCYAVMLLLALVPPLFRRVADRCLDQSGIAADAALSAATS